MRMTNQNNEKKENQRKMVKKKKIERHKELN
jgi:hypothetical protein